MFKDTDFFLKSATALLYIMFINKDSEAHKGHVPQINIILGAWQGSCVYKGYKQEHFRKATENLNQIIATRVNGII